MEEAPTAETELNSRSVQGMIVSIVIFTFLCYLTIGIPVAVLPVFVHSTLGYSTALAGIAVSTQYFGTFFNRPMAGHMADLIGAKKTVMIGLAACGLSGASLLAASYFREIHWASLTSILVGRLILGFGESWAGTGVIVWGIGRVGAIHTGRVISWNGINTYGAMALGAPLGVWLNHQCGLVGLGILIICLALFGLVLAIPKPPPRLFHGLRMPIHHVARHITPFGLTLGAGSIGFGAISTFVTLFYATRNWTNPAYALTAFGLMFIAVRLLFTSVIDRFGGYRVGIVCLAVEVVGLAVIAMAVSPTFVLIGAGCTGAGFALLFPAIGVEAVAGISPASRGAALGVFNVFLDVALGATGPVAGLMVGAVGYPAIYAFGAAAAGVGAGMTVWLWKRAQRT